MSFKEKLKMAGQLWKKAKDQISASSSVQQFDDGRYVVQLTGAEVGESKASSRLQVAWKYTFLDGDYKGKSASGFDGLETEQNLMYGVGPKIVALGYDTPESIEEVLEMLREVSKKKPFVQIRLKTKAGSEFQNLHFDKVLDKDDVADLVDVTGEAVEEVTEEAPADPEVEAEEAAEAEEPTLAIGTDVDFTFKGDMKSGKVISLDTDAELAKIKSVHDGKIYSVKFEKIEIPGNVPEEPAEEVEEEVEAEEEEEEVKKPVKKIEKVEKGKKVVKSKK